ncbi:MAG: hypothetical protein V7L20_00750 [Nostoc sp.]
MTNDQAQSRASPLVRFPYLEELALSRSFLRSPKGLPQASKLCKNN